MILGKKNWNLLAAVISRLLELHVSDADIDRFISYTESKRAKYQMQVDNTLKRWGFPENTQESIYEGLLNGCEGDLKAYLLTALIYIDSKLSFENKLSHFMEKGVAVSEMLDLNTNVEDTQIILLPRAECIWEKKKRSGLRSLMTNYIYIYKEDLGEYKIQNYVMNPNANDILKNRKRLRIAVSPLTNANVLQLDDYERDDIKRIAIKGLGCAECSKEILDKKVLWGIQKACQQDVDIMMYPEMLGTETIVQKALTQIAEIEFSPENKVKKPPFLTLLPTVWKNDGPIAGSQGKTCGMQGYKNGNNTNTLYAVLSKDILDGETYKAAIKQQKQNPYLALEGLYDED